MKRPPTAKLTPIQQTWFLRAVALLILFGLAWLLFFPGSGLLAIYSKRKEVQALTAETQHLQKDNALFAAEIEKMKNDPVHLEDVARREFNLLKPNERVYEFPGRKEGTESDE